MPLYEFVCLAHGNFERLCSSSAATPKCPHGCSSKMVKRILSAPNIGTARTKNIDATLRGLAQDHGLSDMNNHGGDTGAFIQNRNFLKAQDNMQQQILSGQTYAGGLATGDNAIQQTLASGGFQSDNALESVKPLLTRPKPIVEASWDGKK